MSKTNHHGGELGGRGNGKTWKNGVKIVEGRKIIVQSQR